MHLNRHFTLHNDAKPISNVTLLHDSLPRQERLRLKFGQEMHQFFLIFHTAEDFKVLPHVANQLQVLRVSPGSRWDAADVEHIQTRDAHLLEMLLHFFLKVLRHKIKTVLWIIWVFLRHFISNPAMQLAE